MPASSHLTYCDCSKPAPSHNPRRNGACVRCGFALDPACEQSDDNFREFWDRIEASYPGWQSADYEPPDVQQTLRLQTMHRELTGRRQFGHAYLSRDNLREAREELADCLMYLYLDTLRCQRDGMDPEWDVTLSIADDIITAYGKFDNLRHKHRGTP